MFVLFLRMINSVNLRFSLFRITEQDQILLSQCQLTMFSSSLLVSLCVSREISLARVAESHSGKFYFRISKSLSASPSVPGAMMRCERRQQNKRLKIMNYWLDVAAPLRANITIYLPTIVYDAANGDLFVGSIMCKI